MKFIAVNTASPVMEIVVALENEFFTETAVKVMTEEQLLPLIEKILLEKNLKLSDFDDFVCVVGPGSFTGIRIGVNTIRAFAYALRKNAYGVTYNRVMAYTYSGEVTTIVDGGGDVCYVAKYDGEKELTAPKCIYKKDVDALIHGKKQVVSDCGFGTNFVFDGSALLKAAMYAINNKLGSDPIYIRKPQPERKESDI